MILSDRSIREEMAAGRIAVDPLGDDAVQPSSVDVRVDDSFRVFANHRLPFIDVRAEQPELTELVKVDDGEPFLLHPGEFVLGSTYERVRLPDNLVARLEGKALALDTPVPTPRGWRTMHDLVAGDDVFDETGQPARVLAATPPMHDRPCREVLFSDGQRIVADTQHRWLTCDRSARRGRRAPRVVTTAEVQRTLRHGTEFTHHIPLAAPLQYPKQNLPVDPYTLGIAVGSDVADPSPHVPQIYLRSSMRQRTALLRGLMGARGTVDAHGRCTFTSSREHLADTAFTLAAGLGMCPTKDKRSVPDGLDRGPEFVVGFSPDRTARAVVAVREVPSVPVRCIEVLSRSGLFLASRSCIPTHNSSLGRLGLLVHATAGFVDAGWDGWLTLELSNVATLPIAIYPRMKIGQVAFFQLTTPAERPYGTQALGSKYQGQRGPTASRFFENFRRPTA